MKPKFQIAILTDSPDAMNGLKDPASIEWLRLEQTGNSTFVFHRNFMVASSVDLMSGCFDLPDLLGIIVIGSTAIFETIQDEWSFRLPSVSLAFRRIDDWDNQAILAAAIECVALDLSSQREQSGCASLELATYRREFDRLQRSFTRLEEYVARQSYPIATEVFEYPPDSGAGPKKVRQLVLAGTSTTASGSLAQYLPVDSLGLSSFSIYIGRKPEPTSTPLCVKLKAIETGDLVGTWQVDAAGARIGWLELALIHAMDLPALGLLIVIEFPDEESGWALALGPPHPYKEFCASTSTGESLSAPIALRVLRSLPGVRVAPTLGALRQLEAPHTLTTFVPYAAYTNFVQITPSMREGTPTLVFFDRDIGSLTVHPRIGGLTVARLTMNAPRNAWGVFAEIMLAHENASPTEFGMVICAPAEAKKVLPGLEQLGAPTPSFSGWKELLPLERKSISVLFSSPQENELALYLFTRQAPDASPDFAWARFSKIGFHILPESFVHPSELHAANMESAELSQDGAGMARATAGN